jgi:hypothetical protein
MIGLGLLSICFFILAVLYRKIGIYFHLPVACIFLVALLFDWLKGPTCRVQLTTAVQSVELPCSRLSKVREFKEELTTCVAAEQGRFGDEHLEEAQRALSLKSGQNQVAAAGKYTEKQAVQKATTAVSLPLNSRYHLLSFFLLFVQAGLSIQAFSGRGSGLFIAETLLLPFSLICVTFALYHQSKSRVGGKLAMITWTTLISQVVFFLLNFGLIFEVVFMGEEEVARAMSSEFEMWKAMGRIDPSSSLFLRILLITRATIFSLIGMVGIILLLRLKNSDKASDG